MMDKIENFDLKSFDPNKNYVIEASAGTGKTYNIVKIVNSLVQKEHEDLNKILIVTYTDKAADELKDRIRSELPDVNIDDAMICTIHSFCMNVIKELGLSANVPSNMSIVDDSEMDDFISEYIRSNPLLEKLSLVIKYKGYLNEKSLIDSCKTILNDYYLNRDYQEDKDIIQLDNKDAKAYLDYYFKYIAIETSDEALKKFPDVENYYEILLYNQSEVKGYRERAINFANELYQNKFLDFNGRKFKHSYFVKDDDLCEAFDFFNDLIKDKTYGMKEINPETLLPLCYGADIYKKWQERKRINRSFAFTDMTRFVRESVLHDENLKRKLKEKYSRAIIDEFQDTNQLQFDIFKSIFLEDDKHHIIVVGDPKQSIYKFQGADIDAYYNAKNEILKNGELRSLNKNFRSTGDMVSSCNMLFRNYRFEGTNFEDCGYLTKETDSSVHEVLYEEKPVEAFWIASAGEDDDKKIIPFNSTDDKVDEEKVKDDFSTIVAQQILDCCTKDKDGNTKLKVKDKGQKEFRNVSFKDFAILSCKKDAMLPYEIALKKAGIPYLKSKDTSLFRGKECSHWIAIFSAIDSSDFTGRNRSKFKKALFTDFFDRTLTEISSEHFEHDDVIEMEKLNDWRMIARQQKWEDLIDDIIDDSALAQTEKSLSEMQSFGIFKQIGNHCINFLSSGHSLSDLIRHLMTMSKDGEDDLDDSEEDGSIEKNTDFDSVSFITFHSSKGLQYPFVIPIGTASTKKIKNNIQRYKLNGQTYLGINPMPPAEDPEMKRLFYVAYTRAQFVMMLPYFKTFNDLNLDSSLNDYIKTDHFRRIFDNEKKFYDLKRISSQILMNPKEKEDDSSKRDEQLTVLKNLISSMPSKKTYMHSYSSLSHQNENKDEDYIDREGEKNEGLALFDMKGKPIECSYEPKVSPIVLVDGFPKGNRIGSALHQVFEMVDFTAYDFHFESIVRKSFIDQSLNYDDGKYLSSVHDIVENVLKAKLPVIRGNEKIDSSFSLNELSLQNKKPEVEFNFNLFGEKMSNFCNGYVDLIFKRGEYFSIIDWKSDSLNSQFTSYSSLDSLKKHVDDAYSIQRVLYSYCLIKWLKNFYPVLSLEEIFKKHFGGIYYVFLRGCNIDTSNGIYAHTWDDFASLNEAFLGICKKIGGNR